MYACACANGGERRTGLPRVGEVPGCDHGGHAERMISEQITHDMPIFVVNEILLLDC